MKTWFSDWSRFFIAVLCKIDQAVGGRIVSGYRFIQGQFSQNLAGQLFAELYSPLIERIDFPDDTLYKYFVFVQCDQHTQRCRIEFLNRIEVVAWLPGKTR